MGAKSSIAWTNSTWTPIRARIKKDAAEIARQKGYTSLIQIAQKMQGRVGPHCEKVSPGCEHCYSESNNERCLPNNGTGLPFDRRVWDLVDMELDEKILEQPLHWKKPRRVFVCSQTDLFGEFVPDAMIAAMFSTMARCPQHTFQVLTKRAERMCDFSMCSLDISQKSREAYRSFGGSELPGPHWPLPNVWMGVSCEDQQRANERIPHLLKTPAAVRFVSLEPLLGPILLPQPSIDWVIVGGESGPGARPMAPEWARSIRDQCQAAGVPFFFKQWGNWRATEPTRAQVEHGMNVPVGDGTHHRMFRTSRARGRVLDGRTWDEMPKETRA